MLYVKSNIDLTACYINDDNMLQSSTSESTVNIKLIQQCAINNNTTLPNPKFLIFQLYSHFMEKKLKSENHFKPTVRMLDKSIRRKTTQNK